MAILITGAGAIGAQVAAKLVDMGEGVVLYDLNPRHDFLASVLDLKRVKVTVGDVNDMPSLIETIKNEKVDRIIHLVALLPRGLKGRPYSGVRTNILSIATVLEAARTMGVKRVVFASSFAVNGIVPGPTKGETLDEDFDMKVLSNRARSTYEISKLTGEYLGLMYNDLYGVEFVALRLPGGFGPAPGMPSGTVGGMLWKLIFNPALGKPVTIDDPSFTYAGPNAFIYFKDDANAFALACLKEGLKKRVYNVRMQKSYEYMEVVDIVKKIFPEVPIEIKAVSKTFTFGPHPRKFPCDISAARNELGWEPKYDMEGGLIDWTEWIRKNERIAAGY